MGRARAVLRDVPGRFRVRHGRALRSARRPRIGSIRGAGFEYLRRRSDRTFGVGIEINPVGWLYGRVKLAPAPREDVLCRLEALKPLAAAVDEDHTRTLPPFFHLCYAPGVLRFLVAARGALRWQYDQIDATLMALILVLRSSKQV